MPTFLTLLWQSTETHLHADSKQLYDATVTLGKTGWNYCLRLGNYYSINLSGQELLTACWASISAWFI